MPVSVISEVTRERLARIEKDPRFQVALKEQIALQEEDWELAAKVAAMNQIEATTDYKTGLDTERVFDEILSKEISKRKRFENPDRKIVTESLKQDHPLTIVEVDVDKLKQVNAGKKTLDEEGMGVDAAHKNGDAYLIAIANAFRMGVRDGDVVARFSEHGDEFGLIFDNANVEETVIIMKRIVKIFKKIRQELNEQAGEIVLPDYTGFTFGCAEVLRRDTLNSVKDRANHIMNFMKKEKDLKRKQDLTYEDGE